MVEARDYVIHHEFRYGKLRIDFRKDELWELTVSAAFQMSLSNGVRTHRNWLRPAQAGVIWRTFAIQEWFIKVWPNADTCPVFDEALADAEAAWRKAFFVLLCGHGHMDQREG